MSEEILRRDALKVIGAGCFTSMMIANPSKGINMDIWRNKPLFEISIAQWSLHKLLFANEITTNDFAKEASMMGFGAIEYVNSFFKDKAEDEDYLRGLNSRAKDHGVSQLLIMCDGEGELGNANAKARSNAVKNHHKWVRAAKELGCHSIRVNAASSGSYKEQQKLASDGLRSLTEFAAPYGINIIVENHGGYSSNGKWLSKVMDMVDHPMCGTLPDFGNFCMDWSRSDDPEAWYDRYKGTEELMVYAKAVSAKSHEFDDEGNETKTDYRRMLKIVTDAGYRGWVGVEYEGSKHSPREGCRLTKELLETVRDELMHSTD
ncbi:MAG: sugar phosphate isomerase/epimerase [Phycisphaerales bacterium]|nr:sugar phosphate isomerase/epimerase [Phycisphaerales bacterium]